MAGSDKSTPRPALPEEVERIIEQYHVTAFHNQGFGVEQLNNFRAATNDLKAKLAAALAQKE